MAFFKHFWSLNRIVQMLHHSFLLLLLITISELIESRALLMKKYRRGSLSDDVKSSGKTSSSRRDKKDLGDIFKLEFIIVDCQWKSKRNEKWEIDCMSFQYHGNCYVNFSYCLMFLLYQYSKSLRVIIPRNIFKYYWNYIENFKFML